MKTHDGHGFTFAYHDVETGRLPGWSEPLSSATLDVCIQDSDDLELWTPVPSSPSQLPIFTRKKHIITEPK